MRHLHWVYSRIGNIWKTALKRKAWHISWNCKVRMTLTHCQTCQLKISEWRRQTCQLVHYIWIGLIKVLLELFFGMADGISDNISHDRPLLYFASLEIGVSRWLVGSVPITVPYRETIVKRYIFGNMKTSYMLHTYATWQLYLFLSAQ